MQEKKSIVKGSIIGGGHNKILIRQKAGQQIEIGELLVAEDDQNKNLILLQVYDLLYGSQLSQGNLELVSGMRLEQDSGLEFMDKELRNYTLVYARNLMTLNKNLISKSLPGFFSSVRALNNKDMDYISKPENPLFIGKLRSGSNIINYDLSIDGKKVLAEHILITASTGKGKSNLTSCILWSCIDKDYCSNLVLDPHDEYYGRNKLGLKNHRLKDKVIYYSKNPMPGGRSLKINLKAIRPVHFNGVTNFTDAQKEALIAYHRKYDTGWVEAVLKEMPVDGFQEVTTAVIKRKLAGLLDLKVHEGKIFCNSIFDSDSGETTITDICNELEKSRTIIIDTSNLSSSLEILVGSLFSTEIFSRYKKYKTNGTLKDKPIVSIIVEEAPRVLGKEILEKGSNIFSTLAREGRKFKVGLIAITQLPSLIPKTILANMNTKIILGMEMGVERKAIIESASQDLGNDDKNIASLDKGEAIVTSNFVRFATPIKIPLFENICKEEKQRSQLKNTIVQQNFAGVGRH
ncbi:MAG: ATP-binding protein [Candidatus Woesearchaeota archaeon]